MGASQRFIGAVEIGSSKVAVLIGQHTGRELAIIGCGEHPSAGIIKGDVVDYKGASECTHAAIEQAQRDAGEEIDDVFLAQTGGHLEGFYNESTVNVKAADNMIGAEDIRTVWSLATSKELPEGRIVLKNLRRPYRVDGRLVPASPENLVGRRLEVGCWTVHGLMQRVADHMHVISGFNLTVRELILSSLASGHMVTTPEDRQHGVLVVDVGAGTTDYVLYRDGCPHTAGVAAVGGQHVTNDLSIGLRLTADQAEKLKHRYGRAIVQTRDRGEKVWLDSTFSVGDRQFPRNSIEQIVAARMAELFEVVKKRLGESLSAESCAAGVVLTGGTARMPGAAECAAKVFGMPARLGEAPSWVAENLREPAYHTVLGLLYHGITMQTEAGAARRRDGLITNLTRLFAKS